MQTYTLRNNVSVAPIQYNYYKVYCPLCSNDSVKTFFCCHLCIETSFLGFPKFLGEEVQKEMHLFLIVSNFIEFCTAMRVSASRAITINTLNDLGHYTHRICTTLPSNSHEYKSHPFFESYNHHFPNDECLTFQQDQKPCQGLPKS